MTEPKRTYTVCLDAVSIEAIEKMARARDLPARVFLRQLILRSLREEICQEKNNETGRRCPAIRSPCNRGEEKIGS